jgi:hypothetical protein
MALTQMTLGGVLRGTVHMGRCEKLCIFEKWRPLRSPFARFGPQQIIQPPVTCPNLP